MTDLGYIYWIRADVVGVFKIGYTERPLVRLDQLRLMSPVSLQLFGLTLGSFQDEQALHQKLHEHRLHGEWFDRHPQVEASIVAFPPDTDGLVSWMECEMDRFPDLFQDPDNITALAKMAGALQKKALTR